MIGYMTMPADFEFKDLYRKGQPVHQWSDAFRLKHPSMDPGHRAKIFAPFDERRCASWALRHAGIMESHLDVCRVGLPAGDNEELEDAEAEPEQVAIS